MRTVSFLNNFAETCETRLMEFDSKIQNIEASLLILESQVSVYLYFFPLASSGVTRGFVYAPD